MLPETTFCLLLYVLFVSMPYVLSQWMFSFMHSFMHSFIHAFIHSFIHSFIYRDKAEFTEAKSASVYYIRGWSAFASKPQRQSCTSLLLRITHANFGIDRKCANVLNIYSIRLSIGLFYYAIFCTSVPNSILSQELCLIVCFWLHSMNIYDHKRVRVRVNNVNNA